jgi:hypothetical protein
MKSIIRNIIILIVVFIIGVVGYSVFFKKATTPSTGSLQTSSGLDASAAAGSGSEAGSESDLVVGKEFLSLLLNIRSIKLDDSIFTSKAFTTLQDFSRPIPVDSNPGRPNPFAPLGADGAAISTQVSTSNPSAITTTGVTVNGSLAIADSSITRWFEYGITDSLGTKTPPKVQATPGAFAEVLTGLSAGTTYYVKAVALIGTQSVAGNLVTFKTAQAGNAFH